MTSEPPDCRDCTATVNTQCEREEAKFIGVSLWLTGGFVDRAG
jgi:hypothetical protein